MASIQMPTYQSTRPASLWLRLIVAGMLPLILPTTTFAQTAIRYFGGAEFGFSTYEFAQKIDQKLVFSTANITAGMAYGRYNFLASYAFSFDEAEVSEEDFIGDADRFDIDLIVSRQVSKNFSLFGGYKLGETKLHSRSRDDDSGPPPTRTESFEQEGLFLGASYTWQFEDAGRLSMSVAYADLDADSKFFSDGDGPDPGEPPEFDDITGRTSGKTTGFSYNLTWTKPLQGNLLYRTKLRVNRYEQDIKFQGTRFKNIDENSTSLLVGLVYVF